MNVRKGEEEGEEEEEEEKEKWRGVGKEEGWTNADIQSHSLWLRLSRLHCRPSVTR